MTLRPLAENEVDQAIDLLVHSFGEECRKNITEDVNAMFEKEQWRKQWIKPHYEVIADNFEIGAIAGWAKGSISNDDYGIFWVATDPQYRKRGCATKVLQRAVNEIVKDYREGEVTDEEREHLLILLTCTEELMPFYKARGFRSIKPKGTGHLMAYDTKQI